MKLLKFSLWLKGFPIYKAIRELDELNSLTYEEREEELRRRRDEIVRYHYQNDPFYKQLVGDKLPSKFEDLPIIKKSNLQQGLPSIISTPYKEKKLYTNKTSGSSGQPFYFAKDKLAHARTHALICNRYNWHNIDVDSKQARFFGVPLSGMSKYKEKLKDFLFNRVRFHVFDLSDEQLKRYLQKFNRIKFDYVYGYTSALVMFAKYLTRQDITLSEVCPTLKLCIVTSEMCTPEDKQILEKAYGLKVVNEYGASELDVLAFTDQDGDWVLSDENAYYEIVDDEYNPVEDGNEGRILITSLYNHALPIIRYELGDLGILSKVGNKRVFAEMSGRTEDVIHLPSGRTASGFTFSYIIKDFQTRNINISEIILRQTHLDRFVFEIVSKCKIDQNDIALIQNSMDKYLEPNLKIEIKQVDKIKRTSAGKLKRFYSEI